MPSQVQVLKLMSKSIGQRRNGDELLKRRCNQIRLRAYLDDYEGNVDRSFKQ